jgi:hypothetical protein
MKLDLENLEIIHSSNSQTVRLKSGTKVICVHYGKDNERWWLEEHPLDLNNRLTLNIDN